MLGSNKAKFGKMMVSFQCKTQKMQKKWREKYPKRSIVIGVVALTIIAQIIRPPNAFAYLDPGTGSYIFQVLVATLIGGIFTLKIYWQKIKNFFISRFSKKQEK